MGTLRVHFTTDDLARTTVTAAVDPMWEVIFSRFRLLERSRQPAFQPWVSDLRSDPDRLAQMKTGARLLDVLAPPCPYFPDFLTPYEARNGLDSGLDALMSTPRYRLRRELQRLAMYRNLPGWVSRLADGDVAMLTHLADALRDYYSVVIAPYHDMIQSAVAADRAQRARDVLAGGVEGLLSGLSPLMRWNAPVLEVSYVNDGELHLGGRGLHLVPSYFCQRGPVSLADPALHPVLIYPIEQQYRSVQTAVDTRGAEALLGRTRAAVLATLQASATTTELARALQISPASASRHATVLRGAGLILTCRDGSAVLHTITPLGTALLNGRIQSSPLRWQPKQDLSSIMLGSARIDPGAASVR
jgi:DNA-binding transcriptional ArsR family regulator